MSAPRQARFTTDEDYFPRRTRYYRNKIAKAEAALGAGTIADESLSRAYGALWRNRMHSIVPAYSAGEAVSDLAIEMSLAGEMADKVTPSSTGGDGDFILFASLACLLGDAATRMSARALVERSVCRDGVALTVWLADGSDDEVDSMVCTPQYREGIEEAVQLHIDGRPEDAVDRLVTYIRDEWYWNHSEAAWFDSHKHVESGSFHGYWCFEGAATAKALGMDGAKFEGLEYFPMDMFLYENPS